MNRFEAIMLLYFSIFLTQSLQVSLRSYSSHSINQLTQQNPLQIIRPQNMYYYEVRTFQKHQNGNKTLQYPLEDLYLHKKGHTNISFKFRNAKHKKYGWLLHEFQVKVHRVESYQGVQMQAWRKYNLTLQQPIKLKINKQKTTSQCKCPIQQSKMRKKVVKLYKAVVKALLDPKYGIDSMQMVQSWCRDSQDQSKIVPEHFELFLGNKNRNKAEVYQQSEIKLQKLIHRNQPVYYKTKCIQTTDKDKALQKFYQWGKINLNYPNLLQSFMMESI